MLCRGDLCIGTARGKFTGKPRPVLVVQNDVANSEHSSVVVCLLSSTLIGTGAFRILVEPTKENGLTQQSEVAVDRLFTFRKEGLGPKIGRLADIDMARIDEALRRWLDL